ncbi:MAG: PAS domain S-box protein, partial [Deltaproteobacteria bacterium]|nr:PAS domain S-box protein [Deltaproteobacteria bacterium]
MTEAMAKRVFAAYNKVYRTGVPNKAFHYEIIRKDGETRIIENSISLLKDYKGHRIGFRSVVRDITERIRTEEELEKHRRSLQAIFRSVKDAIITVNDRMVVIEANEATNSICGIPPENITGRIFTECSFRCDKICHEVLKNSLEKKVDINEYKIKCRHRDRPEQKVVVTSSPLLAEDGNWMGTVLLIRDITRLSNLERELSERHQFRNIIGKSKKM